MAKGRKATPTALKKLRGTDQPCRLNKNEVQIEQITKLPAPPKYFSDTAKSIYKSKGKELIALKLIGTLDIDLFVTYCIEFANYIETNEIISKVPNDQLLSQEANIIYERLVKKNTRAWERVKTIATQFGFSPSSRASLKMPSKEKKDDITTYLSEL